MRTVSASMLSSLLAQETNKVVLTCVKISHPALVSDLRFVNNTESITRADGVYNPAAFEFRLPNDRDDEVPQGQIVLDNTDRQIIQAIRPLQQAPTLEINLVLSDTPDVDEIGPMTFTLKKFQYNDSTISGTLSYEEDFLNDTFPKETFNPRTTPGIF